MLAWYLDEPRLVAALSLGNAAARGRVSHGHDLQFTSTYPGVPTYAGHWNSARANCDPVEYILHRDALSSSKRQLAAAAADPAVESVASKRWFVASSVLELC